MQINYVVNKRNVEHVKHVIRVAQLENLMSKSYSSEPRWIFLISSIWSRGIALQVLAILLCVCVCVCVCARLSTFCTIITEIFQRFWIFWIFLPICLTCANSECTNLGTYAQGIELRIGDADMMLLQNNAFVASEWFPANDIRWFVTYMDILVGVYRINCSVNTNRRRVDLYMKKVTLHSNFYRRLIIYIAYSCETWDRLTSFFARKNILKMLYKCIRFCGIFGA